MTPALHITERERERERERNLLLKEQSFLIKQVRPYSSFLDSILLLWPNKMEFMFSYGYR